MDSNLIVGLLATGAMAVFSLAALALMVVAVVWVSQRLMLGMSGLSALAARFPAPDALPAGERIDWNPVKVGAVFFRMGVTMIVGPQGFYLKVRPFPSRTTPLLIPWSDLKPVGKTLFFWRPAVVLAAGAPQGATITVYRTVAEKMQKYVGPLL